MLDRIGPYRIVRKLGEGGMGVVYAAEDERLNRAVAIKTIREAGDAIARERFMREARAAASLSHPNVCQLFDIGDTEGTPFLVMELLDGESLAERILRGALPLPEAIRITLAILTALEALHSRGFVHRDLKPSNVFLTGFGVKLLDFGLVRELPQPQLSASATTMQQGRSPVTLSGMIVGTPRYMAPEQILGGLADARTDLFAVAVLLYEMVAGTPPFNNENQMQLFHALVYENAPNLAGSAAISAVNRVIHRAMSKKPEDRYQSAGAMAQDLRETTLISDAAASVVAQKVTRLIVLPFRMLRPDAEIDFLAQAMPEAITTTLAAIRSLIIRSPMAAAKFAAEAIDLKQLAAEADVDVVVTGTLLRAGEQIRVTAQLVAVPGGTVLSSVSSQTTMSGIFELQDALTQRIIDSLEMPRIDQSQTMRRDGPASPLAHEFYLRAGQQGESPSGWAIARDLFERSVDEDPRYAPAWARLARIHLLLGKYGSDTAEQYARAEAAAKRALELNPDLPIAHHAYAHIEVSTGRARDAMVRLLDRVARGSNDPGVFSGLVTVLRFCGLLEESCAAHEQAREIDPKVSTSASHSYWMLGRYEEALAAVDPDRDFGDAAFIHESMGDIEGALAVFEDRAQRLQAAGGSGAGSAALNFRVFEAFRAAILGEHAAIELFKGFEEFPDPEGQYYIGRGFARIGYREEALASIERAERGGFFCYPWFKRDPWLDPLRGDPRLNATLHRAESRWHEARAAFENHAGSRVLTIGAK
jgi:TolB-like protein